MKKIPDGKQWAEKLARFLSEGRRTNFYSRAEAFFSEAKQLSEMEFDGGCYLFHEKENQIDLYFFLEKEAKPEKLPALHKPLVLEQVAAAKNPPNLADWATAGFERYLQRKRLFLSAAKTAAEERTVTFAAAEEAEEILGRMEQAFEPYTSALPDLETLKKDLVENRVIACREGEKLLGFLRFGREKKVSVLWQIVVLPEGRGRGIGNGLVRDWIAWERADAAKFQLWVREDNPSALKLYEALGFLPDGRIAPVMLKKEHI
ncbi:MAG: GNAT family N-acetyltransferase [Bacillota bacterium]|nr:GNAT family N-acetyltransferase [Bacillota bacterium]